MRLPLTTTASLLAAASVLVFGAAQECGVPAIEPELTDLNILGGREARPGSWPWHVGLYKKLSRSAPWVHFCAGALIDEQTVMTAAHCLMTSPDRVRIHLGAHLRTKVDDGEIVVNVTHFCSHPQWEYENADDIAIVRLQRPVAYTDTISPICLPDEADEVRIDEDEVYVTGWGFTSGEWDRQQSDELRQAKQRMVTKEACQAIRYVDVERTICSTHELGSACHGDSGGPLVLERDGRWQLQGVVSGGPPECGSTEWPMYYAEVAKYRDWIDLYLSTVKTSNPYDKGGLCREAGN